MYNTSGFIQSAFNWQWTFTFGAPPPPSTEYDVVSALKSLKLNPDPETAPSSIDTLPVDILGIILRQLPVCSKFFLINKKFASLSNSNTFWHSIALRDIPEEVKKIDSAALMNFKECIRWHLSDEEVNLLRLMVQYPFTRASSYLPREFVMACKAMKEGKPETFKSQTHMGQGTHAKERTNAIDFLNDCIKEPSVFRNIYRSYNDKTRYPNLLIQSHLFEFEDPDPSRSPPPENFAITKEDAIQKFDAFLKRTKKRLGKSRLEGASRPFNPYREFCMAICEHSQKSLEKLLD